MMVTMMMIMMMMMDDGLCFFDEDDGGCGEAMGFRQPIGLTESLHQIVSWKI
jgi:hypothetical protein